jgi:hypothetical protein
MSPSKDQYVTLDKVWKKVRNSFTGDFLLERGYVAVPNLSSAKHFGLFSVFVKSPKKLSISSSYQVIGHVSQVANLDVSDLERLYNSCLYPRSQENNLPVVKKWERDVDLGNGRESHFVLQDLSSNVISMNFMEGDLYLNKNIPEIAQAKKVYFIDEIMKAEKTTLTTMDENDDEYWEKISINSSHAVGFRYSKFRLLGDGLVGGPLKSKQPAYNGNWEVIVDRLTEHLNDLPE